jgi:hypothetical protein
MRLPRAATPSWGGGALTSPTELRPPRTGKPATYLDAISKTESGLTHFRISFISQLGGTGAVYFCIYPSNSLGVLNVQYIAP